MATSAALGGEEILRYSRVAMWLHWLIAALVLVNLFLGFFHEQFARPLRPSIMFYHKAIGISVLGLTLVRIAWRLTHRAPPFEAVMKPWEAALARLIHLLFYVALLAIPLSGWAISSSGGRNTSFLGLFDMGLLPVSRSDEAHALFEEVHALLGYAMLASSSSTSRARRSIIWRGTGT